LATSRTDIPHLFAAHYILCFFQAEDGIRYFHVTGVQTCALPISKWNDEAIAADNPEATLPDTDITIAHRSDGSGTTSNFTTFLDEATDSWTLGAGDTVEWPANAVGGEKNTGVAQAIQDTEGAIGYVDLADANASG